MDAVTIRGMVRDTTAVAALGTDLDDAGTETPPGPLDVRHLEGEFWQRPDLARIHAAALGRMVAPWAVLAHCATRLLCQVPPTVKLPPLIGGPGSLNTFVVVTAVSGGGKSAASGTADELTPGHVTIAHLGSGEGFLEAYEGDDTTIGDGPDENHGARLFLADEGDTAAAVASRAGSTLLGTLRTAWPGGALGFGYRGRNRKSMGPHTYRACLVLSMQPGRAGWLLDDVAGGTPQRFLWFPGTDPRITLDNASDNPVMPLDTPNFRELARPRILKVPEVVKYAIREAHAARQRGEGEALDGHALFAREKFAYALALLAGRDHMTERDWELAGIASAVSDYTRGWVARQVAAQVEADARDRGDLAGVARVAADERRAELSQRRQARIGRNVLDKIADAGPAGIAGAELRRAIAHRDRPWLAGVLDELEQAGQIRRVDARWYPAG